MAWNGLELGPSPRWVRRGREQHGRVVGDGEVEVQRGHILTLNPHTFPPQIWESVPYLTSYVSPVLKEGRSIPLLPQQLEVSWNGKSRRDTPEHVPLPAEAAAGTGHGWAHPGLPGATKGLSIGLPGLFPRSFSCCLSPGDLSVPSP